MTPADVADLLESSGQAFASTLDALPPEAAAWHPKAGEWCVNECVGHIIEAEKHGFAGRIKTILRACTPTSVGSPWTRSFTSGFTTTAIT